MSTHRYLLIPRDAHYSVACSITRVDTLRCRILRCGAMVASSKLTREKYSNCIIAVGIDIGNRESIVKYYVVTQAGVLSKPQTWKPSWQPSAGISPKVRFNVIRDALAESLFFFEFEDGFDDSERGPVMDVWKLLMDVPADDPLAQQLQEFLSEGIKIVDNKGSCAFEVSAQDPNTEETVYMVRRPRLANQRRL